MYLIFKTLNATGEYLLKTQVEDSPDVVESDYTEIASNIEKLEGDVRASFKYFAKEGDKEWWRSFFENYDEIGIYLFELNFIGTIFLLILIIFIINYDDISHSCCLSTYSQTVTCIFRQSHRVVH